MTQKTVGTYNGIRVEFTVQVDEYSVRVTESNRALVKYNDLDTLVNEQFDTPEQAIARAQALLNEMPMREGFREVREWFEDGGARYAARYPGKDVLGRRFEAGTEILRKKRQNLIA